MMLSIDVIHDSPGNARKVAPSAEADAALQASLALLGMLQPVLVVPSATEEQGYELRAGSRRLRAARALGWTEVPAVQLDLTGYDAPETAISAAENMVRAAMHPVDQWRAIVALRDAHGYGLDTAAAALGVAPALARRLDFLGRMDPAIIAAIGQGDLPGGTVLRLIALAPHAVQRAALEQGRFGDQIGWQRVADACEVSRIPRELAIFDTALLAWDEDLFAQPDDEGRFSTADVDGFLALQRAALDAVAAKSKGRIEVMTRPPEARWEVPKGWRRAFGNIPKRWTKDDPRKVFAVLHDSGYYVGRIEYILADPVVATSTSAVDRPRPPRPAISKQVQRDLAALKAEAVRERLTTFKDEGATHMLGALLLLFTCRNVRAGDVSGSPYGDLASALITEAGTPREDVDETALCQLAATLIGMAVEFDAPDKFSASGPGADWLATALGAELPRCDSEAILKGVAGDTLIMLANRHGIATHGTIGAVRKRLIGNLPDWRPVSFVAAGPNQPDRDAADEPFVDPVDADGPQVADEVVFGDDEVSDEVSL